MSDIRGAPGARLLLARLDLQIDQQRLVLEQKDLRLQELAEEQARVEADIADFEARGVAAGAERATISETGSTEGRRVAVKVHELALVVKGKQIRLLELDDERSQIASDKEAAQAHIAKLGAEVSQQNERLKESGNG